MIPVTTRKDQTIALFGLGGSGMVTAQALVAGGANVVAYDDNPQKVEEAGSKGILTQDLREFDFSKADAFVLAPGVPLTHPKPHWSVEMAHASNVPIIGDVALFADERRMHAGHSDFIAITGTNGKSTTTALVSHVLASSGRNVQMGGNIGRAVLSLDGISNDMVYVVECSSYQIDLAPQLDPSIGILLNLAPDHLDRHGTMENYAEIKSRLAGQSAQAILGNNDSYTKAISDQFEFEGKSITRISNERLETGFGVIDDQIVEFGSGDESFIANLHGIATLRGRHNAQNAAAAVAACKLVGLSDEEIQAGLETFPGLAHRMEIIGSVADVLYVNDSKGTNADAAAMALASFDNIYWIAGGLAKEGGIETLRPLFGNIKKAFLIGEAAPEFSATLGSEVDFEISQTLDVAVMNAAREAEEAGEKAVIMLSPACASFDQFANFEIRGEAFRAEVEKLDNLVPYGGS
jgi:UDP-N-acetylmuramoylalanine--D-glutamate ligase